MKRARHALGGFTRLRIRTCLSLDTDGRAPSNLAVPCAFEGTVIWRYRHIKASMAETFSRLLALLSPSLKALLL